MTQVNELLAALSAPCCRPRRVELLRALSDRRALVRKASRDRFDRDGWPALIEAAHQAVERQMEWASDHLSEPHETPTEQRPSRPARRRAVDDRPACPSCGSKVNVTGNRIRAHKSRSGNSCPRRLLDVQVTAPPIAIPQEPRTMPRQSRQSRASASRLDVGTGCRECGKWLPGERSLCGRCFAMGDTA